jgi:hypothetical protein
MSVKVFFDKKTNQRYIVPREELEGLEGEEEAIAARDYLRANDSRFAIAHASPEELLIQEQKTQAAERLKRVKPVYKYLGSGFQTPAFYTNPQERFRGIETESAYKDSKFTPKQDMATVLGVPEANLDTESGSSSLLRNIAGFYTNKDQVKSLYEKNTGAKYTTINIDGSQQAFLKYPDGKAVKVDEVGFGFTDFSEAVLPEILPTTANVAVVSTALLSDPVKLGALFYGPALGAAAETGVREAQAAVFQLAPYVLGFGTSPESPTEFNNFIVPPDGDFDISRFGTRVTTEVLANSAIDIIFTGAGSTILKLLPFNSSTKVFDESLEAGLGAAESINKEVGKTVATGMKLSPEGLERLAAEKAIVREELQELQSNTKERILALAGAGDQTAEVTKKLILESVENYVNKKRSYLKDVAEDIREIDVNAAEQLIRYTEERASRLINDFGQGSYKLTGALAANKDTINRVINSSGDRIAKQNKENYKSVYDAAKNKDGPVELTVDEIVTAIQGVGREQRLPSEQVDVLVKALFSQTLKYKNYDFKTLKELQESGVDIKEWAVSFQDFDKFYKQSKSSFGTLTSAADRNTALAEERIRKLRKKTLKGTEAGRLLDEADSYYVNYHQPMFGQRGLQPKVADENGPIQGAALFENIFPSGDALAGIENLQTAKKLLSPVEYLDYQNSLKLSFLDKHGFYNEKISPSLFDRKNKELAEELFGEQTEGIYDLAKDMRNKKLTLSKEDVDQIIREKSVSKDTGNLLQSQKLQQAELIKKSEDSLALNLFEVDSGKKAMLQDPELAARSTNSPNVSSPVIKDFMMSMEGQDTALLAYKTEVMADLINRAGSSGTSNSFFNASPVIEIMKRFSKKYKQIFGEQEYKQILDNLTYAKSIEVDVSKYNKSTKSNTNSVGRTVIGGSGQQTSFTLLNYIDPRTWKREIQNKILAISVVDGSFDGFFKKMANPDFKYESTRALSKMLQNYIRSEKWSAIITGHDDYLSNYSLEYLGLQGMLSKENSSLREDLQREGAIEKATKQAKAQK